MGARPLKLLAIDDNQDNLITLKAVVRDAFPDAVIATARNGPDGIALARAEDPDVILLDVVMPGMDGYAVCRSLKADRTLGEIPVVFLTALRSDVERRVEALEVGAEGFFDETTRFRRADRTDPGNGQNQGGQPQAKDRTGTPIYIGFRAHSRPGAGVGRA